MSHNFAQPGQQRQHVAPAPQGIPSQRVVFSFLGVVSFATAVLGMIAVSQHITDPQREQQAAQQQVADREAFLNQFDADRAARLTDTDNDTLSDYDELNIYGTSPYLADSDTDGFDDAQEIASGNDPNCPAGVSCRTDRIDESQVVVPLEEFDPVTNDTPQAIPDIENLTTDEIRAIILETGEITPEQLAQIDDETLIEIYNSVLGQTSATP